MASVQIPRQPSTLQHYPYYWVLGHSLHDELIQRQEQAEKHIILLLDYEINGDVDELSHPLSHAGLVKRYMEGQWPTEGRAGHERRAMS